jgi:hypothetical protein
MKELLEMIAKALVDHPEEVRFVRSRDSRFSCSHLRSGEAGYIFPFVLRRAMILPLYRAKGVRP